MERVSLGWQLLYAVISGVAISVIMVWIGVTNTIYFVIAGVLNVWFLAEPGGWILKNLFAKIKK